MVDIHLAADGLGLVNCVELASKLSGRLASVKIHDLYDDQGVRAINELRSAGVEKVWVDYKLHDIPATVGKRAGILRRNGASIITVHASDIDMMHAALDSGLEVFAVTVLTSISEEDVELLTGRSPMAAVLYRARMAVFAGVHGVVCSAKEVGMLANQAELKTLKLVVPGTRSPGVDVNDQKRTDTCAAAVNAGATDLVVGREITGAEDPNAAFSKLLRKIEQDAL